ncbi:MAG: MotA/TolQ/ExbB proton channel family protein [Myxococcota bacterium]|nr:MotA/TolQ/ExbB proton channel family protein [Myxococcota bacterium]
MEIVQHSQAILLKLGAGWVLWVLVVLSIVSVAVVVERLLALRALRVPGSLLRESLREALRVGGFGSGVSSMSRHRHPAARVALRGMESGTKVVAEARTVMDAEIIAQRRLLERRFAFLATLGANAPFVGLLGTVIGILQAFNALGVAAAGNAKAALDPSHVMTGVGEALVATAVGLAVAIPAIVAFNVLQRVVKGALDDAQTLALEVVAYLEGKA